MKSEIPMGMCDVTWCKGNYCVAKLSTEITLIHYWSVILLLIYFAITNNEITDSVSKETVCYYIDREVQHKFLV